MGIQEPPASEGLFPIDVWNPDTFDRELTSVLEAHSGIICNYFLYENSQACDVPLLVRLRAANPNINAYRTLIHQLSGLMAERTIRAWHYTRLMEYEVEAIRTQGIYTSTLDTTRRRLDSLIGAGFCSQEDAGALLAMSAFHDEQQHSSRSGKFWMTSFPIPVSHGDVRLLLSHWGGEVVYFRVEDPRLKKLLTSLGEPRVLEIAAPLKASSRSSFAAETVVATWARVLGHESERTDFDLYLTEPLGATAVMAIHTAGESSFAAIGQTYPDSFALIAG